MTGDEMVEWHHGLNGHEFEYTPGVGDGQGGLACCSPWGSKELDTTEATEHARTVIRRGHRATSLSLHHYRTQSSSVQFSSVTQLCPTLCDPTDCSMPDLPVHHQLPEFTQTHVH